MTRWSRRSTLIHSQRCANFTSQAESSHIAAQILYYSSGNLSRQCIVFE